MKILFVTRKYPPSIGGMETFSAGLVTALAPSVTVIALRGSQLHLLWWLPLTFWRLLFVARRYDVIHFGDGVLVVLGAMIGRIWRVPVTVTLHGLDVTYRRKLYQTMLRWALSKVDKIVCVSQATAREAERRGVRAEQLAIIPNGIILEDWPKPAVITGINANTPKILLSVGRLVPRKGVAWFLENVFPKLDQTVHYHIVGTGPEVHTIQALIQQLKLADRVIMHGQVDAATLRHLYQQASALIMPNSAVPDNPEGFGIVAIEAAACGVPVIAARLDGIADAVIDGASGFLLESRSVLAWIECITRVLDTQPLSPQSIRTVIGQRFSWSAVADQYITLFKQLIVSSNVKR